MARKKELIFLVVTLIGISVINSCFANINGQKPMRIENESEKVDQLNNENKMKSEKEDLKQVNDQIETNNLIDYDPISLPRLIGMADLIVIGEVVEVGDNTFTFYIKEQLLNEYPLNPLLVKKFLPSKFEGPRALPYAAKQDFVLFLSKPTNGNSSQPWEIIGYTGEGEMPIESGFVYFEGFFLQGIQQKQYMVQGVNRNVQRFSLSDFKDAVQSYKECFSWKLEEYIKNDKKRERWIASKKCPDETIETYQAKSWLHGYLVRETINKIPLTKNE